MLKQLHKGYSYEHDALHLYHFAQNATATPCSWRIQWNIKSILSSWSNDLWAIQTKGNKKTRTKKSIINTLCAILVVISFCRSKSTEMKIKHEIMKMPHGHSENKATNRTISKQKTIDLHQSTIYECYIFFVVISFSPWRDFSPPLPFFFFDKKKEIIPILHTFQNGFLFSREQDKKLHNPRAT